MGGNMYKKLFACLMLAAAPITGIYADEIVVQDAQQEQPSAPVFDALMKRHHHDKEKCEVETAFFFIRPSDLDGSLTVNDGDAIEWQYDLYTVKSDGINIGSSLSADINIEHHGIYLITWTVFARSNDSDWISAELQLNGTPIRGSRFTSVNSAEDEASELVGHVIAYIPHDSTLQLVNVTGYGISITTENEGGRNGDVASIAITRIAKHID